MAPKLLESIQNIIKEMSEQDGIIYMTNQELNEYLRTVSYNMDIFSKLKKFKDKKIVITDKLNVSGHPIKSLGPIIKVMGGGDISDTEISDISNVEFIGYVHDNRTPIQRRREAKRRAEIMRGIEKRREEGTFDLNEDSDDLAIKANVLFDYLQGDYDLEVKTPEDQQEIQSLKGKIEELNDRFEASTDTDESEEISQDISDYEEQLNKIENRTDVYSLVPSYYGYYGLTCFVSEIQDHENEEWCIGTESEMDEAAKEYWENYVDEVGSEGFRRDVLEDHLDMDRLRSDIEDVYDGDIRDNPESYLDDDDRELSESQEAEIQKLEEQKNELELRLHDMEPEDDNYDEVTGRIEEIDSEIDDIKESPEGDYKEEAIEEKIADTVDYYVDNYREFLGNMGYDVADYLDKDSLVEYLANNEGYGQLSSYDNDYYTSSYNDETYYIIRQN